MKTSRSLARWPGTATMDPHPQLTRAAFGRLRRSLAETASVGRREAPGVGEAEAAGDLTNRGSHHIVVQLVTYLFDPDRMKRRERRGVAELAEHRIECPDATTGRGRDLLHANGDSGVGTHEVVRSPNIGRNRTEAAAAQPLQVIVRNAPEHQ